MKKTLLILTAALALLLATASAALGQSTGTISGIVSDQSGAIVAGANVRAQIPATNYKRETTTATNGFYRFNQLPVGVYTIEVEAAGFKKTVTREIALSVNDSLTLDINLEVGQVSETVTVSEAAAAVNTETSVLGKTVDNRTLNDLPSECRTVLAYGQNNPNADLARTQASKWVADKPAGPPPPH